MSWLRVGVVGIKKLIKGVDDTMTLALPRKGSSRNTTWVWVSCGVNLTVKHKKTKKQKIDVG